MHNTVLTLIAITQMMQTLLASVNNLRICMYVSMDERMYVSRTKLLYKSLVLSNKNREFCMFCMYEWDDDWIDKDCKIICKLI